MRLRVSYSTLSSDVTVSISGDHDHTAKGEVALTAGVKKMIKELSETGLLPYRIHETLRQRGVNPLPVLQQIQNQVKRNRECAGAPFTDVQLRAYCDAGNAVPEDPDKSFIFSNEVNSAKEFFYVQSTPKLLEAQKNSGLLQLDFIVNCSGVKSDDDLADLYHRSCGPINTFGEYRQQRLGLYVVAKSANGAYYTCSCHDGSKKRACKHATMVMCSQIVALHTYPPDAVAQLLQPRRKNGRPTQKPNGQAARAAPQNRFALAAVNP